jgi:predicted nucleotidyltransferase
MMAMRPSELLERYRPQIRDILARYRVINPRVFGSVALGTDKAGSDLDLLISDPPDGLLSVMTLGGINAELEDLLGIGVDVIVESDLSEPKRSTIVRQARPL